MRRQDGWAAASEIDRCEPSRLDIWKPEVVIEFLNRVLDICAQCVLVSEGKRESVEVAVVAHRQAVGDMDVNHNILVYCVLIVMQAVETIQRVLVAELVPVHCGEIGDNEMLDGLQIVKRKIVA